MSGIRITYVGDAKPNQRALSQLSELAWACLRKNKYAEGTECIVKLDAAGESYADVEAAAMEPGTPHPLRVFDILLPLAGFDVAEFDALMEDQGLTRYRHAQTDSLVLGGDPGKPMPDTALWQGVAVPTGRNDPCRCGSGKKYKRCCMPAQA